MTKRREKKTTKPLLAAVVSDLHFPFIHRPTWRAFKQWHAHVKPDITVILGDFLDFASMSRYPAETGQSQDVVVEIQQFVKEANTLARECGRLVVVGGNHDEERWYRKIIEPIALQFPGMKGLGLHDQCLAHGLLHSVEWYIEGLHWRGFKVGNMILRHGHKQGSRFGSTNLTRAALTRTLGQSQMFGHHHRVELTALGTATGTRLAVANGHMTTDHGYSLENNWVRGFTILEVEPQKGFTHAYPVVIEGGRFAWGGKLYG